LQVQHKNQSLQFDTKKQEYNLYCSSSWSNEEVLNSEYLRNNIYHTVTFCPTYMYIPYMNLGVYILWLFVLPTCTYGSWIKVYIYIVTSCPTYIHVKQKYKLWLFVLWLFVLVGVLWLFDLWLFVVWLSVRLPTMLCHSLNSMVCFEQYIVVDINTSLI
jgi:hypothetical protein